MEDDIIDVEEITDTKSKGIEEYDSALDYITDMYSLERLKKIRERIDAYLVDKYKIYMDEGIPLEKVSRCVDCKFAGICKKVFKFSRAANVPDEFSLCTYELEGNGGEKVKLERTFKAFSSKKQEHFDMLWANVYNQIQAEIDITPEGDRFGKLQQLAYLLGNIYKTKTGDVKRIEQNITSNQNVIDVHAIMRDIQDRVMPPVENNVPKELQGLPENTQRKLISKSKMLLKKKPEYFSSNNSNTMDVSTIDKVKEMLYKNKKTNEDKKK